MLVAGSTRERWTKVEADCRASSASFIAIRAPESKLRGRAKVV